MNNIVLDASALLALINEEPGAKRVEDSLSVAVMSAVNISEVLVVLLKIGMPPDEAKKIVSGLINEIIPFDRHQADTAALLSIKTKSSGLSLGDRACLALGLVSQSLVLTADKAWAKFSDKINIEIIR